MSSISIFYIYIYIYISARIVNSSNLLNVLAKDPFQVFDVVLNYIFYGNFIRSRSSFQEVFCFFFRIQTIDEAHLPASFFVEHLLMAASTYHCFSLCYYCSLTAFVLLPRNLQTEKGLIL